MCLGRDVRSPVFVIASGTEYLILSLHLYLEEEAYATYKIVVILPSTGTYSTTGKARGINTANITFAVCLQFPARNNASKTALTMDA